MERRKRRNMNKKIISKGKEISLTRANITKAMDELKLKLVQRLIGKNRKIMCNYNSK